MTADPMALASNLIFTALLLVIVIRAARFIGKNDRSMVAVFFTFSATSLLLSYIYWLAYELLRPGIRMPFAANEMGEMACNLLLASALAAVFAGNIGTVKETVYAIMLQIACIFLWIGWSGEWVQDIITGIALCYFVLIAIKAAILSDVFSGREWIFQGISMTVLVIMQALTFALVGTSKQTLDIVCYILIFAICVFYAVKAVRLLRSGCDGKVLMSFCAIAFIYGMNAMYMSADPMYYAAEIFDNAMFVIMALSVKKVVTEE